MDIWKFHDIRHAHHLLCNPMNSAKFEAFCRLLHLRQGARVVDIACGKGEFLIRLAELYDVGGVGVDISPYCIRDCREKKSRRAPSSDLTFLEGDGRVYQPDDGASFDLAMCIGASWVYGGYRGTLQALKKMTTPGGLIAVGEPFWLQTPSDEYLQAEGMRRDDVGTLHSNVQVGEEEGLTCLYTVVSNHDDWDHYETYQLWAVDDYVRRYPEDPDNSELLERTRRGQENYFRWGRDTVGWAIYLFRKP